jgi:hypothetical protein
MELSHVIILVLVPTRIVIAWFSRAPPRNLCPSRISACLTSYQQQRPPRPSSPPATPLRFCLMMQQLVPLRMQLHPIFVVELHPRTEVQVMIYIPQCCKHRPTANTLPRPGRAARKTETQLGSELINGTTSGGERGHRDHRTSWARRGGGRRRGGYGRRR